MPRSSATSASRTSTPPARCATCSCPAATCSPTASSTRGRRRTSRGQAAHVPGRPRPRFRLRAARLVGQPDPPDGRLLLPRRSSPTANRLARVPGRHRHDRQQGRRPPGDRHDLAADLRPASAYLLTGEDRFLEAAETGTEYLREHLRNDDKRRRRPTGTTPSRSTSRARRRSSPRNSATTTRPSRPTSRSTPWPARPRPTGSPATRRSRTTSTHDLALRATSTTPRTAATSRTSTRSRSTARAMPWAATGPARTGTRWATTPRPT